MKQWFKTLLIGLFIITASAAMAAPHVFVPLHWIVGQVTAPPGIEVNNRTVSFYLDNNPNEVITSKVVGGYFVIDTYANDKIPIDFGLQNYRLKVSQINGDGWGAVVVLPLAGSNINGYKQQDIVLVQVPPESVLTSIVVDPDSATVKPNIKLTLNAFGYDQNGQLMNGINFNWAASGGNLNNQAGANVIYTAGAALGNYVITASSPDGTIIKPVHVTISNENPIYNHLEVLPADSITLQPGAQETFTAKAKDQFGNTLANIVNFNWVPTGGALNVALGPTVTYTAGQDAGPFSIMVSYELNPAKQISITISNQAPVISSIDLIPAAANLFPNQQQIFTAMAKDQNNNAMPNIVDFNWDALGGALNTMLGPQVVYTAGPAAGNNFTITATRLNKSKVANITINAQPVLTTIDIDPAAIDLKPGDVKTFTAIARDQLGNEMNIMNFAWSATGGGHADNGNKSTYTAGDVVGPFIIEAAFGNVKGKADITIALGQPLEITTLSPLPEGQEKQDYNDQANPLQAVGGTPPYTWVWTSAKLPLGLQLNADSGKITGIPAANSNDLYDNIKVTVTDSAQPPAKKEKIFAIKINPAPDNIGTLKGTVTNITNGAAIVNALITLSNGDFTNSIANGNYTIDLGANTYKVIASIQDNSFSPREYSGVTIVPNQQTILPIQLIPNVAGKGSLAGFVKEANGAPIGGVVVTIGNQASQPSLADGSYYVSNIDPNVYAATATKGQDSTTINNVNIVAEQTTSLDIVLPAASQQANLVGFVRGDNGQPIAGATVALNGQNANSNNLGYYQFINVPAGTFNVVCNKGGDFASAVVTLTNGTTTQQNFNLIAGVTELTITTASPLPDAKEGEQYQQVIISQGGAPNYSFSAIGVIPNNIVCLIDGTLTGIPQPGTAAVQPYTIRLNVSDTLGNSFFKDFALKINAAAGAELSITNQNLPDATVGVAYAANLQAANAVGNLTWTINNLPAGLLLNQQTGAITGTPQPGTAGTTDLNISVVDGANNNAAQKVIPLNINPEAGTVQLTISRVDINLDQKQDAIKLAWATNAAPDIYYLIGDGTGSYSNDPIVWTKLDYNNPPLGINTNNYLANKSIILLNQVGSGNPEVYYKALVANSDKINLTKAWPVGKVDLTVKAKELVLAAIPVSDGNTSTIFLDQLGAGKKLYLYPRSGKGLDKVTVEKNKLTGADFVIGPAVGFWIEGDNLTDTTITFVGPIPVSQDVPINPLDLTGNPLPKKLSSATLGGQLGDNLYPQVGQGLDKITKGANWNLFELKLNQGFWYEYGAGARKWQIDTTKPEAIIK